MLTSEDPLLTYPSGGWRKALFRFPLLLWRAGLGPIIGQVLLLLTHTGRKSGLPRHTLVEYYRLDGVPYSVCAWGERSQWGRNILADPRVTIQTARGIESALARRVTDPDELRAVYELFMRRDPWLTKRYLNMMDIRHNAEDLVAKHERVYIFRFDPAGVPAPPPQPVDLAWLWPFALLVLWLRKRAKR